MIARKMFKCIEVGRGYKIFVKINMNHRQLCTKWNVQNFLDTLPAISEQTVPDTL